MGILSRSADLVYTFRFLRLLTTPWVETSAYELGIIDEDGKRTKLKLTTSEQKSSYNTFHRLVFNIKRLIEKVPGGKSRVGSYAAALFLLKEHYDLSDTTIQKILDRTDIVLDDMIKEESEWFISEDGMISPGIYRVNESKVLNITLEEMVKMYDKVRVEDNCYPVGHCLGIPIYEVIHIPTNQTIYVSSGELIK